MNRFFKIRHRETVRSTYCVWIITHTGASAQFRNESDIPAHNLGASEYLCAHIPVDQSHHLWISCFWKCQCFLGKKNSSLLFLPKIGCLMLVKLFQDLSHWLFYNSHVLLPKVVVVELWQIIKEHHRLSACKPFLSGKHHSEPPLPPSFQNLGYLNLQKCLGSFISTILYS